MNKETKSLKFEGEETTKRGPGYNHPLAIAARARLACSKPTNSDWVLDLLSLNPEVRAKALENKH